MRFLRGALTESDGVTDDEPALELALARAMLTEARGGEVEESLRIYRPAAPVAVFGRRDTRLPGFPDAVEAARAAGFEPVVRATGGRAVAYTGAALVVDHVRHEAGALGGQDERFAAFGQRFVDLFRGLGVDARLGAVPGEYCPGAHSVNEAQTVFYGSAANHRAGDRLTTGDINRDTYNDLVILASGGSGGTNAETCRPPS